MRPSTSILCSSILVRPDRLPGLATFLPRVLGVLLAIDGLGWVTYPSPPLAHHLLFFIAAAAGRAEIPPGCGSS